MIAVTLEQLHGWINAFMLPFARIAALMAVAPLLGERAIPTRAKAAAAAALAVAIAPSIGQMPQVPPGSWGSLLIIGQQIVIGLAMGLCIRVIFAAIQMAGDLCGLQMGLSFATLLDPATGANTTVLSRLFNIIALLVFISLDGHLLMLAGLAHSFDSLPISSEPLHAGGFGVLIEWSGQLVVSSLLMALPVVTALLSINLAMGILNRTAPQISVFAVGFPVSLLTGLTALGVALPGSQRFLENSFNTALQAMQRVVQHLAGG